VDEHGELIEVDDANSFSYQSHKDGVIRIFRSNRLASTLKGREAQRFLSKVNAADEQTAQMIMAKVTGQYKFGNEKQQKNSQK